ncbi:MAG TPA: hypothetical protein VMY42_26665 [Thermoguttaceae bacterium]|nr:hypothetical protein [Thermoguttaceae bacterium]
MTLVVLSVSLGTAVGEDAVLKAKPVLDTAVAGVPVVVALTYQNQTTEEVSVPILIDGYMFFIRWHWKAPNGDSYRVTVRDLHYRAIPEPAVPARVVLSPGQQRTWYSVVPTPKSFGTEKTWKLEVTVTDYDPLNPPLKETTASVSFSCRDLDAGSLLETLGSTWAQAAMIGPAGKLLSEEQLQIVKRQYARGDVLATLVLFSDAIDNKLLIGDYWEELEAAPAEARCLRNYLMWTDSTQHWWSLPEKERDALLAATAGDDSLFVSELRQNLLQPSRSGSERSFTGPVTKPSPPMELIDSGSDGAATDVFSPAELEAARTTAESFAGVFRERAEEEFARLLLPRERLSEILSPAALEGKDVDSLYGKMVSANTERFREFRAMCGDLSKITSLEFHPGMAAKSTFFRPEIRAMKNSFVVLSYANRVRIAIKIETMVLVEGKSYISEID